MSSRYLPSSASNNNTSITKVSRLNTANTMTNTTMMMNTNSTTTMIKHNTNDEFDFDSGISPPALSPYALSILDDKIKMKHRHNSNNAPDNNNNNISSIDTPKNNLKSSTLNSITLNEITGSSKINSINNTPGNGVSKHSKFMKKLGLGAPRRLMNNGEFQSAHINTHNTTNSINTKSNTNLNSTISTTNTNLHNLNRQSQSNQIATEPERKHSLTLTPNRYSPVHKRSTLTSTNKSDKLITTPTKSKSPVSLIESPEIGRKVHRNLSDEKPNGGIIDIFEYLEPPNKEKENKNFALNLESKSEIGFDHIQTLIDKKKEILQLRKEIKHYRAELDRQKSINQEQASKFIATPSTENQLLQINKRSYKLYEQIGKGGSSKVYKGSLVESPNKYLAIKIVNLDDHEASTIQELKGEVKILHKLRHCPRVVRLLDYLITSKNIYFVMECGNLDLATVLSNRHSLKNFYDLEFIRYHAQEMVKCINTIHELDVVHLDLKPANFVFVSGILKLIDFGISNSIKGHTVNVYREFQMGTPNYMAPETLIDSAENENGLTIWKVGKPADIWSFGCILYQLTYGTTPYAAYNGTKKILAITNPSISISYPTNVVNLRKKEEEREASDLKICPYLIDMIRRCLIRDPTKRIKANELLNHSFINPVIVDKLLIKEVVRGCVGFGGKHPELKNIALGMNNKKSNAISGDDKKSQERLERLIDGVWKRVSGKKIE